MPNEDQTLRDHLSKLLQGGSAHTDLTTALDGFPLARAGEQPAGLPYSAWQLLEHMRIATNDLLEFSTNPGYREMQWPDDYWPKAPAPPTADAWERSVRALKADLAQMEKLVQDDKSNLTAAIPWGKHGETLLREVLLAADHTSYHTGEFIVLRRLLGEWHT